MLVVPTVAPPATWKTAEKSELPVPPEKSQQILTPAVPVLLGGAVTRAFGSNEPALAELKVSLVGSKVIVTSIPKSVGSKLGSKTAMLKVLPGCIADTVDGSRDVARTAP